MSFDKSFLQKLSGRLEFLYGENSQKCLKQLENLISSYLSEHGKPGGTRAPYSHRDVYLITYGDTVVRDNEFPLETLKYFADRYLDRCINGIHILPFFPYSSDDGFSVVDYRQVREDLGDWEHIQRLSENYKVMADLVINHVSSKSLWFKAFQEGKGTGKDFFHVMDPLENLTEVTRPRSSPLLTETQTKTGLKHVWTTFSADQVDVNFANPDVLIEYLDILLFYLSKGIRVIRLDAVAFLWKRAGTPCIHLEETHEVVRLIRDLAEYVAPDAVIITETNVPHKENISYFGDGDEAHMVYNFSLPPLLLHAILTQNATYLSEWSKTLTPPPEGCTYFNFTASHDGIGVRPLEGLVPKEEFDKVIRKVKERGGKVSYKKNPDGNESPYELNITYFSAFADPGKNDVENQIKRFMCSQALMLSFRGVPGVYLHSFTASENYLEGAERTGERRTINRKKWNYDKLKSRISDEGSPTYKVLKTWRRLLEVRRAEPAFDPRGGKKVLMSPPEIFAMERTSPDENSRILIVGNVARKSVTWSPPSRWKEATELITGEKIPPGDSLKLEPWQVMWIRFD